MATIEKYKAGEYFENPPLPNTKNSERAKN